VRYLARATAAGSRLGVPAGPALSRGPPPAA